MVWNKVVGAHIVRPSMICCDNYMLYDYVTFFARAKKVTKETTQKGD